MVDHGRSYAQQVLWKGYDRIYIIKVTHFLLNTSQYIPPLHDRSLDFNFNMHKAQMFSLYMVQHHI